MLFQPFNKATRRETPKFVNAAIAEGRFDAQEDARVARLRGQTISGGMGIYDRVAAMEEAEAAKAAEAATDTMFNSTIGADLGAAPIETGANFGVEPIGAEALGGGADLLAAGAVPETGMAGIEAAMAGTEAAMAPGLSAASMAETAALAEGTAAATAATTAGAGAGAAGAGAGTGILASMGPYGWAAMAAMALLASR